MEADLNFPENGLSVVTSIFYASESSRDLYDFAPLAFC